MGNPFLLQACLRLEESEIPESLELGKEYTFSKREHRIYQINVPMDLRTSDWKFICRIIVKEYKLGDEKTEGTFIPVKMFSEEEKEVITRTFVSEEEVNSVLNK